MSPKPISILYSFIRLVLPRSVIRFPHNHPVCTIFFSPIRSTCPLHYIFFDSINLIVFYDVCVSWNPLLANFLVCDTSFLLGTNNFLSTLWSNTFSPRSSDNVRNKVSHSLYFGICSSFSPCQVQYQFLPEMIVVVNRARNRALSVPVRSYIMCMSNA